MSKGALVIGGSVAGIQAALDLANSGIEVHLVEPTPFLGQDHAATIPEHLLNARLLEVAKHPLVTVWTNTRVTRAERPALHEREGLVHPAHGSVAHASAYEGATGRFYAELRQHPRYVDLCKCTACGDCIQVCPVTVPGTERTAIHLPAAGVTESAQPGCAAIDKLGKAPCANACPGGIHVQGYIALIAQGRFQEAIDLIREAIPFPAICGRICTHPCEANCRRSEVDSPVSIRLLKRFVSDWELSELPSTFDTSSSEAEEPWKNQPQGAPRTMSSSPVSAPQAQAKVTHHVIIACACATGAGEGDAPRTAKRIAIVGAGPGGMAVADRLARLGYGVTVFEKLPVIGGMMAVGIPEYRLPRDVIAREYHQIQKLGIELRLGTTIGPDGDLSINGLLAQGYRAVCLAVGAHRSHALRISGEDLPGVVQGIELLKTISLSQQLDDPHYGASLQRLLPRGANTRAAVLGGGNTAMDVARSLKRLGLQDVRVLYRRTRAEMPALPEEIEETEREGVPIEFLVAPVRVLGDDQVGVTGLECQRMKLGEPDASGRRRPVPIAGSEFISELELVVLAIGQAPDLEVLGADADHGIAITREERINVDGVSFMTSRPGVFAVGDAVTTDKMAVIEAIGMGKRAAAAIDAYVQGLQPHEVVVDAREVPIARRDLAPAELTPKPRIPVPTIPIARRLTSYAEVELGYTAGQAMAEAQRCLVCGPCSECLACVRACRPGAVVHEQQERIVPLQIGAVIDASDPANGSQLALSEGPGLYRAPSDSALHGSAAAAKAMFDLFAERTTFHAPTTTPHATHPLGLPVALPAQDRSPTRSAPPAYPRLGPPPLGSPLDSRDRRDRWDGQGEAPRLPAGAVRLGVFVCQCGDQIAGVVDTETVRQRAEHWPEVVHAQELAFSCSPEAAETIQQAVTAHSLNRVVLAACSCCSIDQVCYSCTYQRVRCKGNLGVFLNTMVHSHQAEAAFEFVNIREQCAWVHAGDPRAATAKATALIAAAVAKVRMITPQPEWLPPSTRPQPVDRSVVVLGTGNAAISCLRSLGAQGLGARHVEGAPEQVTRAPGHFVIVRNGREWQGGAVVLAPRDDGEAERLLAAFGADGPLTSGPGLPTLHRHDAHWPRPVSLWGGLDTHRPGVLICDPAQPPEIAGAAAAARVAAWLGRSELAPTTIAAVVDPARCRACHTCVEVCEFGAAQLLVSPAHAAPQVRGGEPPGTLPLSRQADPSEGGRMLQGPRRASWIDPAICTGCGTCAAHCPSGAITPGYATDAQLEAMLQAALT